MKKFISMLLAMIMVLSLVACGGGESAEGEQPGGEEQKTETMVEGGAFVMAIEESINSLVWYNNNSTDQGEQVFQSLYDPLWNMNLDGTMDFYLAESCEISEDGCTYTVKMRDGVKWHDGEAVTADDVIYTLAWFQDENCGVPNAAASYKVDGEFCTFEKIDEMTFSVTIARPSNMFASRLGYLHP